MVKAREEFDACWLVSRARCCSTCRMSEILVQDPDIYICSRMLDMGIKKRDAEVFGPMTCRGWMEEGR